MKHCIAATLCSLTFSLCTPLAFAQTHSQTPNADIYPTPAHHLIIMDSATGEILFEKNARAPMAPASMTKIMTASVVFDRIKSGALSLDDEFVVSEDAWTRGGVKSGSSTMFLKPKSKVSVRDLLHGVIIQSGNDACITLAQGIAGSEAAFALLMNAKAKELGLTSANFTNATGWPDEKHEISAYDLARLAQNTIKSYPEFYKIYAKESFTWNGIKQPNRNPLFSAGFPGADGLKTGHTTISKYGFVGSAKQGNDRRIIVVNGLESKSQRRSESVRIMRSAFNDFAVYDIYKADSRVGEAKVFMGKSEMVSMVVKSDVNLGIHKIQRQHMKVQTKYLSPLPAPVLKGDEIGTLIISLGDTQLKTLPLYAGEDVERKSLLGRLTASLIRKIRGE